MFKGGLDDFVSRKRERRGELKLNLKSILFNFSKLALWHAKDARVARFNIALFFVELSPEIGRKRKKRPHIVY